LNLVKYQPRVIDIDLDRLWPHLPALSLEGAKGVGKTVTAERRVSAVVRLDDHLGLRVIQNDPKVVREMEKPVLIDEWQRFPPVWDMVRRAVDHDMSPGQFFLTGSASPMAGVTHSGAGRIVSVQMRPMSFAERGVCEPAVSLRDLMEGVNFPVLKETQVDTRQYIEEICASGFPGIRQQPVEFRADLLGGYLRHIVDRDFPEAGHVVRRPESLRRWLRAYAAATSTTASYEKIRDAATSDQGDKPAKATTVPYRDILQRMWILEPLEAWLPQRNHITQLSTPPKHHLVDPALAARLLHATPDTLLRPDAKRDRNLGDGPLLGALFESLVTQSVRVYAQAARASVQHFRTQGGEHEVDLIVVRPDGGILAVEAKLAGAVSDADVKHLRWLREKLGDEMVDAIVVNTGPYAYRRQDGIGVVPLALLGP
jgi:uncharacterized protein